MNSRKCGITIVIFLFIHTQKHITHMKKSFIVRRYTSYEFIHTEEAYCKLQVLLKYYRQGWKIWDYPIWFVIFMKKRFGITLNWGNQNLFVEKLIPGSDQITHYYPY